MVLRSPYAHARLGTIAVEAARAVPGVIDAVHGAETARLTHLVLNLVVPDALKPLHPPLAVGETRFVGDPVAAVLAETRRAGRDALDLIEVEYEPISAVVDAAAALADDAPRVHAEFGTNEAFRRTFGTPAVAVDAAFAAAYHVVAVDVRNSRVAPMAIEPRSILADYDPAHGFLTVWVGTQRPHGTRNNLAALLGLPPDRVRVIAPDMGGAFGAKGGDYGDEILAAYLAVKHGRPVHWNATRSDDLASSHQGRDTRIHAEGAFSRDGRLLALRARVVGNLGAYLQPSGALPHVRAAKLLCGAYQVPVARTEVIGAFTNTVPTGPYRGAGRPEAAHTIERLMDLAGRDLGLDPVEMRRRNFIQPRQFPYTTALGLTYDSGEYDRTLDHLLALADYTALGRRRDQARRTGKLFGIGLATFVEPSGSVGWEAARVRVEPDGRVVAQSGSSAHGQGHRTTFAQIIADRLEVPIERVEVVQSDTAKVAEGVGTMGSRSTALGGSALLRASDAVLEKMRLVAAHLLEAQTADVAYGDGTFSPVGVPGRGVPFDAVAAAAYQPGALPEGTETGLEASDKFSPSDEAYANGAHLAAVTVDPESGRIRIEAFVAVDDAGVLVNPLLAEGQVHGGLAQGIGQAVLEQVAYDEEGTLLSGTLGDYAVPRAADLPPFITGETETPTFLNPLGAKGVGEGGTVGAPPAIVNAVVDALFDRYGVRHLDMPLTAERVWQAMHHATGPAT